MRNDLISRQEALAWVNNLLDVIRYYHPYSKSENVSIGDVIDALERVPAEDAVPVIRCKGCKWWNPVKETCIEMDCRAEADGFCAWAERKEE